MKLEHYIASQTTLSRRRILDLLKAGRILVNNTPPSSLLMPINLKKDTIMVDNKVIKPEISRLYYKFNKPDHVISTLDDPKGRPCLKEFMKQVPEQLFPVGRLDRHSTGLLLFTNDGEFANKILHPKYSLLKTYQVTLEKTLKILDIKRLQAGFFLSDGPCAFEDIDILAPNRCIVTLSQGRNRIVRRMFEHLGYVVQRLHRLSIGNIYLGDLKPGKFRRFMKNELPLN
ncbi:pseudouridine synthase [Thermoproteota archaeon]